MKLRSAWGAGLAVACGLMLATAGRALAQGRAIAGTEIRTVAGVLAYKVAKEQGTKYLAAEIMAGDQKYVVTGKFLGNLEATEPILRGLAGKRVTAYGQVPPSSPKEKFRYLMMREVADLAEQKLVDLAGTLANEKDKDEQGKPVTRLVLTAGGKKYAVVGKQALAKLNPLKGGGTVKAKCYLNGGDDCLEIAEVVAAEAAAAPAK